MFFKNFITLFLLLTAPIVIGCGSGSSSNSSNPKSDLSPVKASINLRLGQLAKSSTPVAISAALENGESIIIFSRNDGANSGDLSVVYKNSLNQALRVIFDKSGRPLSAESMDSILTFSNYTMTTVDITISYGTPVVRKTFLAQPIDTESLNFLDSNTIIRILLNLDKDEDSPNRALLANAFSSLKIVGCISDDILMQIDSFQNNFPEILSSVTNNICNSPLLNSIRELLDQKDYKNIRVIFLNSLPVCDIAADFETEISCFFDIAEQNAIVAGIGYVGIYPPIEEKPAPEAKPSQPIPSLPPSASPSIAPTKPPAVPSPSPSPKPIPLPPSENLGFWFGTGMGSTGNTGCRGYDIDFTVTAGTDSSCSGPNLCPLTGNFNDQEGFLNFAITGNVDGIGHFTFSGTSNSGTILGDGNLAMGSGTGNFNIDNGFCPGSISLSQSAP